MSLYNMINGFNPACLFFLPMLGRNKDDYPRFRDCFVSDDGERIVILTKVGGGNRNCDYGEQKLYEDPNFVKTYDADWDNTYGYYEFNVPEKWKTDFDKICSGKIKEVSDEYYKYISEFYPFLAKEGFLENLFRKGVKDEVENNNNNLNNSTSVS